MLTLHINTKDQKQVEVYLKDQTGELDRLVANNEYGSQALLPLIVTILDSHKITFKDLSAIEVEEGPGSFTGLRVGASVAQALAFVLNIPLNGAVNKVVDLRYT